MDEGSKDELTKGEESSGAKQVNTAVKDPEAKTTVQILEQEKEGGMPAEKLLRLIIQKEQAREGEWRITKSGLKEYNSAFFDILHDNGVYSFDRFTESRAKQGKRTFAIDIMGDGVFLRELPHLDGGVAVTLVDTRDDIQKEQDRQKNITVIVGDVTQEETWNKIRQALNEQGRERADLITNRGIGGIKMLPEDRHDKLIEKSRSLLSPDNGLFVSQVRAEFKQKFPEWAKKVKSESSALVNFRGAGSPLIQQHSLATIAIRT